MNKNNKAVSNTGIMQLAKRVVSFFTYPQFLLLVLAVIGYYQVSLFQFALKWDMIDCYYPWRYMVGECLQNHILPWWNPYETLGYPLHADPQSGAWYPIAWIIGYFRGYDIYSMSFEFMLHIYIAALGMLSLAKALGLRKNIAFAMAVCYMFSGLIIGNAQHLTYIISAAWIPFIIAGYLKFNQTNKFLHALIAAFFMFMLVAGGYPAFTIILFYFLLLLFFIKMVGFINVLAWSKIKMLIKTNMVFAVASMLFSAVVLVSVYLVQAYITRANKLPLDMAMFDPLSPQCLISFVLPYAAIKENTFFATDLSMTNIYFGILPFLFCILSLFVKKPLIIKVFFWWGIFCLAAAMGNYLPVRKLLYDYVPMMGMFRFPSIFRLYAIIGFLVAAGYGLQVFVESERISRKQINILIISFIVIFAAMIIYARAKGYLTMIDFIRHDLFIFSERSTIWQHITLQAAMQLGFLIAILFTIIKVKEKRKLILFIIAIITADMICASQLNAPYTVYSHLYTAKGVKQYSNTFPKNFPVPSAENIVLHTDTGLSNGTFWKNMNIFNKRIAWDGFTPFKFNGYEYLVDSMPGLFRSYLSNPPVFLSAMIFPEDSMRKHTVAKNYFHKNIYLSANDYASINKTLMATSKGDTAFITSFSPVDISIHATSKKQQILALLQNNYPGWTAIVNGKETAIIPVNKGFIGVMLPTGESKVEFQYDNLKVRIAGVVSVLSLLCFTVFIILTAIRKINSHYQL